MAMQWTHTSKTLWGQGGKEGGGTNTGGGGREGEGGGRGRRGKGREGRRDGSGKGRRGVGQGAGDSSGIAPVFAMLIVWVCGVGLGVGFLGNRSWGECDFSYLLLFMVAAKYGRATELNVMKYAAEELCMGQCCLKGGVVDSRSAVGYVSSKMQYDWCDKH